jgi:hypothetical protein
MSQSHCHPYPNRWPKLRSLSVPEQAGLRACEERGVVTNG